MPSVFRQGDHICSLFEMEDEQITIAADDLAWKIGELRRASMIG
jgi:hypothetical protein